MTQAAMLFDGVSFISALSEVGCSESTAHVLVCRILGARQVAVLFDGVSFRLSIFLLWGGFCSHETGCSK